MSSATLAIATAEAQTVSWEARKAAERPPRPEAAAEAGALDGVPRALPALLRAEKIQKRAARVGFDWNDHRPGHRQDRGGTGRAAGRDSRPAKIDRDRVEDELGDVLFAVANLARHCKVDPEAALRSTNDKFEKPLPLYRAPPRRNQPSPQRRKPWGNGAFVDRS